MKDTLHLPLKAKWYDMIESGVKTEEYRVVKPYWIKRFCHFFQTNFYKTECKGVNCLGCMREMDYYDKRIGGGFSVYQYKRVCFSYGYTKCRMTFEIECISRGKGREEWGAPKYEDVFIIKLGKRIK